LNNVPSDTLANLPFLSTQIPSFCDRCFTGGSLGPFGCMDPVCANFGTAVGPLTLDNFDLTSLPFVLDEITMEAPLNEMVPDAIRQYDDYVSGRATLPTQGQQKKKKVIPDNIPQSQPQSQPQPPPPMTVGYPTLSVLKTPPSWAPRRKSFCDRRDMCPPCRRFIETTDLNDGSKRRYAEGCRDRPKSMIKTQNNKRKGTFNHTIIDLDD
jgi:hypothetical protein